MNNNKLEELHQKLRKKHPTWSHEKREWILLQALGNIPSRKR